ncbi:transposase [Nocardia nova]|uniref:transposase n=1 Tax=Nocardia nova TaxID=37330 RepID=UPI00371B10DA
MTLLRQIRAMPHPKRTTPRVLGIDDFALARGHRYGKILIDTHARRPVDVLTDRTDETLTTWLRAHPVIEDRLPVIAAAPTEAGAKGAPDAIHRADRWLLWHTSAKPLSASSPGTGPNLSEAVEGSGEPFARAQSRKELLVHNGTGHGARLLDEFKLGRAVVVNPARSASEPTR